MCMPVDKNISVKGNIKINSYKDLEIESEKMLRLKTITLPTIVGSRVLSRRGHINTLTNFLAVSTNIKYKELLLVE